MKGEALVLSLIMCGLGLALVFVYFNAWGFVLDGVGFMVFLYAIFGKDDRQTVIYEDRTSHEKKQFGENYNCRHCMFFGKEGCSRHETWSYATPCEAFVYSNPKDE